MYCEDENGTIRVGGRLEKSYINNDCKHPILMPKNCHISKLIILWCHQKTGHSGRGMTLNEVEVLALNQLHVLLFVIV